MANSVDPDQMLCSVTSDLGLHCLLRHVCPHIYKHTYAYMYLLPEQNNGALRCEQSRPRAACLSGPSCSKLTMSLVNDSLKFTSSDTLKFFAEKM